MTLNDVGVAVFAVREKTSGMARVATPAHPMQPHRLAAGGRTLGMTTIAAAANTRLHSPMDAVSEPEPNGAPSYASRSATKQYRTAPLAGLWQHPPYFHNGTAATLEAVQTYNTKQALGLTSAQAADLVQYLKSL